MDLVLGAVNLYPRRNPSIAAAISVVVPTFALSGRLSGADERPSPPTSAHRRANARLSQRGELIGQVVPFPVG